MGKAIPASQGMTCSANGGSGSGIGSGLLAGVGVGVGLTGGLNLCFNSNPQTNANVGNNGNQ